MLLEQYHKLAEASEKLTKPEMKAAYDEELANQVHSQPRILKSHCCLTGTPGTDTTVCICHGVHALLGGALDHGLSGDRLDERKLQKCTVLFPVWFSVTCSVQQLRYHILNKGPVDCNLLGISRDELEEYARNENNPMPFFQMGKVCHFTIPLCDVCSSTACCEDCMRQPFSFILIFFETFQ